MDDGMSSASRQKVVDRNDFAGLVVRLGLVGALDWLMVSW
jgi:hypothetical protein